MFREFFRSVSKRELVLAYGGLLTFIGAAVYSAVIKVRQPCFDVLSMVL